MKYRTGKEDESPSRNGSPFQKSKTMAKKNEEKKFNVIGKPRK